MADASLDEFRRELRAWLDSHCPRAIRNGAQNASAEDRKQWLAAAASRGYTTPTRTRP